MINLKPHNWAIFFLFACILSRCTGGRFITPVPRGTSSSSVSQNNPDTASVNDLNNSTDQIDFGTAFPELIDEEIVISDTQYRMIPPSDTNNLESPFLTGENVISYRYPPFSLLSKMVRVVIQKKSSSIVLYTVGLISAHSAGLTSGTFRGRILLQKKSNAFIKIETTGGNLDVALPCTLLSSNKYNFIEFDGKSYRGSMILSCDNNDGFMLINYLEVEEYLRGVIPLEIGQRPDSETEALKAQAVAARTYTYRRILERQEYPFDLTNSVSDQVYGGADVEYRESDLAVKMTKDLILTYKDSLICAYYHSTCGGKTASIDEVWNKPPEGYLVSINDVDSTGQAYCSISPAFKWQEHWPTSIFNSIVFKNLIANSSGETSAIKSGRFSLDIIDYNPCGRINKLAINGNGWQRDIFDDKIRYVFRRNITGQPILRSTNFMIKAFNPKEVIISGTGYGHGVGMCQMGAIGRARVGQSFDTILKAYYTGVQISTGVEGP